MPLGGPEGALASNSMRLIVEQLLVMQELGQADAEDWMVNARK